jgi:hypothetical protein
MKDATDDETKAQKGNEEIEIAERKEKIKGLIE